MRNATILLRLERKAEEAFARKPEREVWGRPGLPPLLAFMTSRLPPVEVFACFPPGTKRELLFRAWREYGRFVKRNECPEKAWKQAEEQFALGFNPWWATLPPEEQRTFLAYLRIRRLTDQ
jgi:hypothetical protein